MLVPYPRDHVKDKEGEQKQRCQVVFPKSHQQSDQARWKPSSPDLRSSALVTGYAASQPLPGTWIQQTPACELSREQPGPPWPTSSMLGEATVVLLVLWKQEDLQVLPLARGGFGHHGDRHSTATWIKIEVSHSASEGNPIPKTDWSHLVA